MGSLRRMVRAMAMTKPRRRANPSRIGPIFRAIAEYPVVMEM